MSGLTSSLVRASSASTNELGAWREALLADEDSLTSCVMERLAYLAPGVAWKILSVACEPLTSGELLPGLPLKDPSWHFWPTWIPAAEDARHERVVPDVVLEFPDLVVCFEAQLHGEHRPTEWAAVVRTAQQGQYRGRRVVFVALGGRLADAQQAREALPRRGPDAVPMFHLAWDRFPAALDAVRRSGHLHQGQLEVLRDIEAALADRGYRPRLTLGSLASVNGVRRQPWKSLATWKTAQPKRERPLGFAWFDAPGITTPTQSLLNRKGTL
jgi:hypothetical protein